MSKTITIKLTKASPKIGPFDIIDDHGIVIATDVSIDTLIGGISYLVNDDVLDITLSSKGACTIKKTFSIGTIYINDLTQNNFKRSITGCLWRHLTNVQFYNYFYGTIEPYIIEYPVAYQFQDEILQNVKDYTKAYQYTLNTDGVFNSNAKIETDNVWFNKAILYNGQQCSGMLNLVPKPLHNLKEYMKYPIYNSDSKTITFTKSDNFYQYNTFWALNKSSQIPSFTYSCKSLSIDKILNQSNMDYGKRSFKKAPLRAKDVKIRHILDNRSDVHLVSQFIFVPSQISYK